MSLERHWQRVTPLSAALYPLSLLYRAVVALRRAAYVHGVLPMRRVGVPVVIVGNVYVGGTGKTPLVLWLTRFLRQHGRKPGIVSRGYRGSAAQPSEVSPSSSASDVGDEPLLLARRSGCPVWIGRDRGATAQALLAAHPGCDVIVADDGLQHYRLAREVEIAVVDAARGLGNGLMLPAGPLREPASRLGTVDAVVLNGMARADAVHASTSSARTVMEMNLSGSRFRNLRDANQEVGPEYFHGKRVSAIAGIGNPARFFAHLESLGMACSTHAFPDHHAYVASDLDIPGADAVVMTEKDAVKCEAFATNIHWVLPVDAEVDSQLGALVLRKLETSS